MCSKAFDSQEMLDEHIETHARYKRNVDCNICGKLFISTLQLEVNSVFSLLCALFDIHFPYSVTCVCIREKNHTNATLVELRLLKDRI